MAENKAMAWKATREALSFEAIGGPEVSSIVMCTDRYNLGRYPRDNNRYTGICTFHDFEEVCVASRTSSSDPVAEAVASQT